VSAELVQLVRINDPALQIEHVFGALVPPAQKEPLGQEAKVPVTVEKY